VQKIKEICSLHVFYAAVTLTYRIMLVPGSNSGLATIMQVWRIHIYIYSFS